MIDFILWAAGTNQLWLKAVMGIVIPLRGFPEAALIA